MILRALDYFRMKPKPLFGIDVGSSFTKMLALARGVDGEYIVEAACITRTTVNANSSMVGLPPRDFKEAAIGLSNSAAFSRVIQMNKALSSEEMREQIEVEAHHMIPYPLEEVYYDFEVLGLSRVHSELVDVLFVASKIETVNARIESMQNIGGLKNLSLNVRIVDLESQAMERAFVFLKHQLPIQYVHTWIALLDIGVSFLTCHVFHDLKWQYSREHNIQAASYHASIEEQIQQALQQFNSLHTEAAIQVIMLAGGFVAYCEDQNVLVHSIEKNLGITIIITNPFLNMTCAPSVCEKTVNHLGPTFMLALGLALRNFD